MFKSGGKSGGNVQREARLGKDMDGMSSNVQGGTRGQPHMNSDHEAGDTTTITHHGDGTHTVQHADGESHEKISTGEIAMHLHAKHESGPAMHVHNHEGTPMHQHEGMEAHHTVTTHHVGHDGAVAGPHHHGSVDEAAEHMKSSIGDGGGEMPHEGGGESAAMEGGSGRAPLY